jgi:excisionase family DNA binding protein
MAQTAKKKLTTEIADEIASAIIPAIREAVAALLEARLSRIPGDPYNSKLLTARQVGAILQVPTRRVYDLMRNEELPFLRIGKRQIRFDDDALRDWMHRSATSRRRPAKAKAPEPVLFDRRS